MWNDADKVPDNDGKCVICCYTYEQYNEPIDEFDECWGICAGWYDSNGWNFFDNADDKYGFLFSDYKDIDTSDEALENKLNKLKDKRKPKKMQLFFWLYSLYLQRQFYAQQPQVPSTIYKDYIVSADIIKYNIEYCDETGDTRDRLSGTIYNSDYEYFSTIDQIETKIITNHNYDAKNRENIINHWHGEIIAESPLKGLVLRIGNRQAGQWEIVGTTCGYA